MAVLLGTKSAFNTRQ